MIVVRIDHREYLFPDNVDTAKLMKLMQAGTPCSYHDYGDHRVILREDEDIDLAMKVVPAKAKIVREIKGEEVPVIITAKKGKGRTEPLKLGWKGGAS